MIGRNIMIPLALSVLVACSSANTYVIKPIDTSDSPSVVLRIKSDTENLSENIARRIQKLGFRVIPDGGSRPDYYANVQYTTFWDVVHQTFNQFEIAFVDAKNNENRVRSLYTGRFGFKGCDAALDLVFEDLSSKLKKGT